MQALTTSQKTWLQRGGRIGCIVEVVPISGQTFTLTDVDIINGSLAIDRPQWAYSGMVEIGNADAAELTFELDNFDGRLNDRKFEGAVLTVSYDINGETLPAGRYIIDNRPRKMTTLSVKALDFMSFFNKAYDTDLVFPATLAQILADSCTKCEAELITTVFTNSEYVVAVAPAEPAMTYHQVVAWVAELAGCNAWMDWDGKLRLSWYGENQLGMQMYFSKNDYFAVDRSEGDVRISGVEYNGAAEYYLVGSDSYSLIIDDNPLLQSDHDSVLGNIFNKVRQITWQPLQKLTSLSYPQVWPGDLVQVECDDLVTGGETLAEIVPAASSSATISEVSNPAGVLGGSLLPYNSARIGLVRMAPAIDSATLCPVENADGVIGTTIMPYVNLILGAIISRHHIGTVSEIVSAGESETSYSYASSSPFTAQQRRAIKEMIAG